MSKWKFCHTSLFLLSNFVGMERIRRIFSNIPSGLFTYLTLGIILWLTLAPKPLGDEPPKLFPGADKIVHALMFGFFAAMMMLDWQRQHQWKRISPQVGLFISSISAFSGIIIEFLQDWMDLGRGFEYLDILADVTGAFLFGTLWLIFQNYWSVREKK